jgi:hypothetical protein
VAVEHLLGMLAAGDDIDTWLEGYPWLRSARMSSPASLTRIGRSSMSVWSR